MRNKGYWQSYLTRVVIGDENGFPAFLLRIILGILELVYLVLLNISYLFRRRHRLPVPVISIGNIIIGGTGKTPAVVWLVKLLKQAGITPAILTRGYGGTHQKEGICFKNSTLSGFTVRETGDEPYLLAKLLPDTLIIVGRNRYQNGLKALTANPEIDLFILDDGFQHWGLERELDIVAIDAAKPFSNRHLLPRGFLREPVSSLKRAGVVLITRTSNVDDANVEVLKNELISINPELLVALVNEEHSFLVPLTALAGNSRVIQAVEFLKGRKISAITAIGNPFQFLAALEKLGAEVGYFKAFPDHYYWQETEIVDLIKALAENGFTELIVTAKDGVKLEPFADLFLHYQMVCCILSLDFLISDQKVIAAIKASVVSRKG